MKRWTYTPPNESIWKKIRALEQCGLEVVERVALEVQPAEHAMRYLRTKKEKMGHLINVA